MVRRFIKSYVVRRHVQFTVVQDGEMHEFTVQRWAAVDAYPETIETFTYAVGDNGDDKERARAAAIASASRLAAQEKVGRAALGGDV